jgi:predicted dehydrogenase
MSAPVRIGLVGCGRLAELGYLPAAVREPGVRVTAVADPDAQRARLLAERAGGAAVHRGAEELVAAGGVDAVVVASPPRAHLDDARAAAAAGLPVLVEKPPAPDADGARRLADLRPAPWVALNRRFEPGMAELRERLAGAGGRAGAGGVRLELRLHYRRASWQPRVVADDVLLDLGPHVTDLAGWLGGSRPIGARAGWIGPARATFELVLEHGHAGVDLALDRPHRELAAAYDASGRALGAVRRGGLRGMVAGLAPGAGEHGLVASLTGQLRAFAGAVRGADPGVLATAEEGVHAMAVLDAVRASARAGGRLAPIADVAALAAAR